MAKATYKDAGVDLETYADAMARLPKLVAKTHGPRVQKLEGGFAGLFQLDFAGKLFARRYEDPVLVSCTDGVGTKLKLASMTGVHDSVGIDLVAMSINDAICCGAEPLFFLDYVAMPKDDPALLEQIVAGIVEGCVRSDCALLGGETAIMPDLYALGDYDLAGFCVGVAEKGRVIDGSAIQPGDVVLGIASSGPHSNGYSLIRKVVFDIAGLKVDQHVDVLGATVGETLLEPTRIYARPVRDLLDLFPAVETIKGIAHVTGGGLHENLQRILPANARATIQRDSWPVPPVFPWLQGLGEIDSGEMHRVFNMGIGLVLVISSEVLNEVLAHFEDLKLGCWKIGQIEDGDRTVVWAD